MKMLNQLFPKLGARGLVCLLGLLFTSSTFGQATITSIPTLGGSIFSATAMNNSGQVVGFSATYGNAAQHAFLFSGGVLTDLGTLGGTFSSASGINNAGQIIGDSYVQNNVADHAFLLSGGVATDLGTLGGTKSIAVAINGAAQVAGNSQLQGNSGQRAFLYTGGTLVNLGTLGGSSSLAVALNNAGQIAGNSSLPNNAAQHAFLYSGNALNDLGTLGGSDSTASGLNDAGQVVGASETANFDAHAFVFHNGLMTDLGTLGGTDSSAYAINNSGQVIGDSTTASGESHAFLYQNGVMTDLGTLGGDFSTASAVNSLGQVVGKSDNASFTTRPFLWQNGAMVDLNSMLPANSGWDLRSAPFINDAGQIVGLGFYNGGLSWYLLSLQAANQPPVADAGADQTVECPTAAVLDGSKSRDPEQNPLTFEWREGSTLLGNGVKLSVQFPLGSHLITLTVTDSAQATAQSTVRVNVVDTTPPAVSMPAGLTVPANSHHQAAVPDLLASLSASDNCTAPDHLVKTQNPPAGTVIGLGVHPVTVTVADAAGNTASCNTLLTVGEKRELVLLCPPAITLHAHHDCEAMVPELKTCVRLSEHSRPVHPLTKTQNPPPGTLLGLGTHPISVTLTDAAGNTAMCTVSLRVVDKSPPVIHSAVASPNILLQPTGQMVPVTVTVSASDNCDAAPISRILSIRSNEDGHGRSDRKAPDWEITGALTANLRAEQAHGEGERIYTIKVQCTDASGNDSTKEVKVVVEKNHHSDRHTESHSK